MVNENVPNITGTTFGSKKWSVGQGQRVWREIRHRYPSGGTIQNLDTWKALGIIPSGTPCKFDQSNKTIIAYTNAEIKAAEDLTIDGFLQEDIVVGDGVTVATGTVIYAGEIYEYMFEADVVAKVKPVAPAEIHFVN